MQDKTKEEIYEAALKEIQIGRGPFKVSPLAHAAACIDNMKDVARRALALEFDEGWGEE